MKIRNTALGIQSKSTSKLNNNNTNFIDAIQL